MFGGEVRSATVEAVDDVQAVAILAGDLKRLLSEHPEIAVKLLGALAARLRETNARISRQSFQKVSSRVAGVLVELAETGTRTGIDGPGGPRAEVVVRSTQADLAQLAGTSREAASRFLATLQRAGVLTTRRGRIVVHDPRRFTGTYTDARASTYTEAACQRLTHAFRPVPALVRPELLLAGLRGPAQARPQDRDDQAGRQEHEVPPGAARMDHGRLPPRAAREGLHGRDRRRRGQAGARAVARDIEHDNPEFRRVEDTVHFLEQIYGREVSQEDFVTVIRFSQVIESTARQGLPGNGHRPG